MNGGPVEEVLDDAFSAQQLDHADTLIAERPGAAREIAREVLAAAPAPGSAVSARAHRLAGDASRHLHEVDDAIAHYRAAIECTPPADEHSHGGLLLSLSGALALNGRTDDALERISQAEPMLGVDAWQAKGQRATILHWAGRQSEAAAELRAAIDLGNATPNAALGVARLRVNLALNVAHLGGFAEAETEAELAELTYRSLGHTFLAAQARHNRGWIAGRAGAIATAIALMESAAAGAGHELPAGALADRAELLLDAGCAREALELAEEDRAQLAAAGQHHQAADVTLLAARACLELGLPRRAADLAQAARTELSAQGRSPLTALADLVDLEAAAAGPYRSPTHEAPALAQAALPMARQVAHRLSELGRVGPRNAAAFGTAELVHAAAPGSAEARRRWHAVADAHADGSAASDVRRLIARAHLDASNRTGLLDQACERARDRSLVPVSDDLRNGAAAPTRDLVRHALLPAMRAGDGPECVRWLEAVRPPLGGPVLSGHDVERAAAQLRELDAMERAGSPAPHPERAASGRAATDPGDPDDADEANGASEADGAAGRGPGAAERRQLLERRLVGAARRWAAVPDHGAVDAEQIPPGTTVWWFVVLEAGAWVVSMSSDAGANDERANKKRANDEQRSGGGWGRSASVHVVPPDAVTALDALTDALAMGDPSWHGWTHRAGHLLEPVLGPLAAVEGDLVVIPWGQRAGRYPFGALPQLWGRPHRLCWSLSHLAATTRPTSTGSLQSAAPTVAAVAGPHLGAGEVARLADIWPGALIIDGEAATATAARRALSASSFIHLAAHGHARRDNPMLSWLQLADGPLYGYEVAALPRVPETVVLWSCDLGATPMPGGAGMVGWAPMLTGRGCRRLVAATGPLPDGAAAEVADGLHRGAAKGLPLDGALAGLRAGSGPGDDDLGRVLALTNVYGAGD